MVSLSQPSEGACICDLFVTLESTVSVVKLRNVKASHSDWLERYDLSIFHFFHLQTLGQNILWVQR